MKIRNILSVLLGGILLAGCSSEDEIQPGKEVGRDTSFSVTLTLGEINAMTKAGGDLADGYTYSTVDEVNVNNVVIAIFSEGADGTVRDCLDYKTVSFTEGSNSTVTVEGKTIIAYKVDNIQAKTGKVRIVAIANSMSYDNLSKKGTVTYSDLQGLSESVSEGTFDASNLVKVGELSYDLTTSVSNVQVPMTQLAARIDMKFTVDEEPEEVSESEYSKTTNQWFYKVTKLTVKNINQKSDLILFDRNNQYDDAFRNEKEITLQDGVALPFYTYEKLNTTTSPLSIYVTGDLQKIRVTTTFNEDMTIQGVTKGDVIEEEKGRSYKYENFNPTTELEGCTTNGIIHGNRYELTGKISMKTQRINFTVSTTAWEGVEKFIVDVVIADLKYLFVRETKVVMANITEYKIEFASSSDVTIVSPAYATYEEYYLNGKKITKRDGTYYPNSHYNRWTAENEHKKDQYPAIVATGKKGFITITSKLPVNYFPKQFVFGIKNSDGLEVSGIVVDQYPPQYLEGKVSKEAGPKDSPDGSTNPNIFTITVKATGNLIVGNPSMIKDGVLVTKDDVFSAELVSPKFVVASRFGAVETGTYTYSQAVTRCKNYWEKLEDGTSYPAGTWRVPTLAELEFMNTVQDASPAVNYLFNTNGTYWSAMPYWYYDFGDNIRNQYSGNKASSQKADGIRCVHDLY